MLVWYSPILQSSANYAQQPTHITFSSCLPLACHLPYFKERSFYFASIFQMKGSNVNVATGTCCGSLHLLNLSTVEAHKALGMT